MLGKTREVLSLELIIYLSWGKTYLSTLPNILWITRFSSLTGRNRYYPSPSESTACCYIQSFQVVLSPALGSLLTHRCIHCRSAPDWVRKECERDLFVNCKVLLKWHYLDLPGIHWCRDPEISICLPNACASMSVCLSLSFILLVFVSFCCFPLTAHWSQRCNLERKSSGGEFYPGPLIVTFFSPYCLFWIIRVTFGLILPHPQSIGPRGLTSYYQRGQLLTPEMFLLTASPTPCLKKPASCPSASA